MVRVQGARERNGAWWVYIDHNGKRKAKRVGEGKQGKKAAELAATKIAARLAEGGPIALEPPTPTPEAPTFAAIAEEWLQKYPALHAIRPATLDNYRSFTMRHLVPAFGHLPITDVSVTVIEDFRTPGHPVGGGGA
jgi:integrase